MSAQIWPRPPCAGFGYPAIRLPTRETMMSELDAALSLLRGHRGVEHLTLLGRDGLVVQYLGDDGGDEETVAARVPEIAVACEALGTAARKGAFSTAVIEYEGGVAIIVAVSGDLLLAALLRPEVGFAPLLRDLRRERDQLAELV